MLVPVLCNYCGVDMLVNAKEIGTDYQCKDCFNNFSTSSSDTDDSEFEMSEEELEMCNDDAEWGDWSDLYEFEYLDKDDNHAPVVKRAVCECGKDKHGFISHSNWCPKVYEE